MPKARKRKEPIVQTANPLTSAAALSCRNVIRRFHTLLKRRRQAEENSALSPHMRTSVLAEIGKELESLGGLTRYQQLSCIGQSQQRGGGSEKVLIQWMKEAQLHQQFSPPHCKLRLLEVGALKPDNYQSCSSWMEWTPIDLHSRHPNIMEQDFLLMNMNEHREQWDAISLSLVVNFVPSPVDRGRMLQRAYEMLKPDGLLFLALPLPCVANSRYMTLEHLESLMNSIGFNQQHEKWRTGGKMGYWLYYKTPVPKSKTPFKKKIVLRTGHRNNFTILLED